MTAHPTDDQGWPICRCESCREKSRRMNAEYILRLFNPAPATDHYNVNDPWNTTGPHAGRAGE